MARRADEVERGGGGNGSGIGLISSATLSRSCWTLNMASLAYASSCMSLPLPSLPLSNTSTLKTPRKPVWRTAFVTFSKGRYPSPVNGIGR
ncbi:hypothetical protein RTBOTA2_002408 [Rhodotorula toruloides]|nr:hypothetical protein RTBOTA2_002408 [Rhodotorula toruloides]